MDIFDSPIGVNSALNFGVLMGNEQIKKDLGETRRPFTVTVLIFSDGAPGRIRTCDLWIRSPALYPAELRAHKVVKLILNSIVMGFMQDLKSLFWLDFSLLRHGSSIYRDCDFEPVVFIDFSNDY
jgi:hypothetical protein